VPISGPISVRAASLPDALVPTPLVPGEVPAEQPVAEASTAPEPDAPSVREIWAKVRAQHREPRAYVPNRPRDVDCLHLKCIALTFDDGPGEGTDKLLELLARTGVRATFFVLGRNVKADPTPTIRAAWDGHEIGVHTWDHRSLKGRATEDIATDILRTSDEIARVSGVRPTLVRPPYGDIDAATAHRITKPVILWSVDPDDWRDHDPALITQRVVEHSGPGSIVLLHDVYRESEQAVPAIIEHYRQRGFTFVTVSELYGGRLKAGRMYHGRELAVAKARAKDRARGLPEPAAVGPVQPESAEPMDPAAQFPPEPSAVPPPDPVAVEPQAAGPGTPPDPQTGEPGTGGPGLGTEPEADAPETGAPPGSAGPPTPTAGPAPPEPGSRAGRAATS
jgi:peptidoglycan/xylan/chitin deacetylase (PgdA/CDA1 family)